MNLLLYMLYFWRITKYTITLHFVLAISFALIQVPHFLEIMHGIRFTIYDIFLVMSFRTLEWISAIFTISFISTCIMMLFYDIEKNNLCTICLQLGQKRKYIVNILFFICIIYANLFLCLDGLVVPHARYELKNKMFSITKDKIIAKLIPCHIVSINDWSFAIGQRLTDYKIDHLFIQKEKSAAENFNIMFLVNSATFFNIHYTNVSLSHGIGEIKTDSYVINFEFSDGELYMPEEFFQLPKDDKDKTFFEAENIIEFLKKTKLFFTTFILPFWLFILLFSSGFIRFLAITALFVMLFYSIEVFAFNFYIFTGIAILILLIYRRIEEQCEN